VQSVWAPIYPLLENGNAVTKRPSEYPKIPVRSRKSALYFIVECVSRSNARRTEANACRRAGLGCVIEKKRFCVVFCLVLTTLVTSILGESSHCAAGVERVYIGSFGSNPGAAYLRTKLFSKLAKSPKILIVHDPATADAVLKGVAAMWLVGYYNSNPRIRYRNSTSVPVYDAKLTAVLDDKQGRSLWSGNLKPHFWDSQYVSDNVVNQAARHIVAVLRDRE